MNPAGEFELLLAAVLHGEASPAQLERLRELMRSDASLRAEYVAQMRAHALLRWSAGTATPEESPAAAVVAFPQRRWGRWLAGVAAVGLLGFFLSPRPAEKPQPPAMVKLEVLEASQQGGVGGGSIPITTGMELSVSELQMPEGSFRFRLGSGVVVGVTGPAELQFFNAMHLRVIRGKVTADVGEEGKGFIVDTAQTRVVDLGTRFGVDVAESGHTDVVVFQGEVELYDADRKSGAARPTSVSRLVEGEAVRVNVAKEVSRISSVSSGPVGDDEWSTSGMGDGLSTISAVHDNLHNPKSNFYYRILRGGMREDARAFIAKRHEWNGLDEEGLPDWLVGADLVQTFPAGDRNGTLQLTVTTTMPAELYVIVDSRVPAPTWLADAFQDTGERIGLENAPLPDSGIDTGKGPGGGNLAPFAVWKRVLPQAGDYVLGPPPLGPEDRPHWMYGIAARKF
ncbi:FecR family protein [Luteolibacter sp. SL250]|uniref:FecR domain-containing protein n=1 Tax=Luteolibacter sp. SL250 TaxID=2995170 RepID=UPI00226F7375|nr:FecR family protein [Luteolibacter sp. SL250]WAC18559.1 FecR family protein [Luteolibacter sp. SL250]